MKSVLKKRKKIILTTLCIVVALFGFLKIYYAVGNHKFDNKIKELKDRRVVKRLAEMRKQGVADIVVTISAGNEGMSVPNNLNTIINSIIDQTDANGNSVQSATEKSILSEQILIVGDNNDYSNNIESVYTPNSPNSAAGGRVDISDLSYPDAQENPVSLNKGTSFAAPEALAIIRDVMAETCLTARQAMQATKQAIYESRGTLTREGALAQAKILFNITDEDKNLPISESWFKNTKWNLTESGQIKTTVTWTGQGTPPPTSTTDPYSQNYLLEFTSTGYTADNPSNMPAGMSITYRVTTPGTLVEECKYNTSEQGTTTTLNYTRTYSLTSVTAQTINVETKMNMTIKASSGGITMTTTSNMTAQGTGTRR